MTRRKRDAVRQGTVGRARGEGLIAAPKRGAALLWIAVLAALALIGWMALSSRGETPPAEAGTAPRGRSAGPESPEDASGPGGPLEDPAPGPRTLGSIEIRPSGGDGGYTRVFDGVGTIAGQVRMEDGSAPPRWTLHVEPSLVTRGRSQAVARPVGAAPAEETFEVRDLPMGAYRVFATAPGHRSSAVEVALYKLEGLEHLPGMNYVNLTVTLRVMASVDGIVRRASGDPADGLPVHLLPRASAAPGDRISAVTDLAGVYRFDAVPEGNWLLCVGDHAAPLVSPRPVQVDTRPLELDEVQLPALAALELLVVDEAARPFPDVDVVGYLRGAGRGSIRGRTGPQGRLRADYLQPGPWRIEATYATLGYTGKRDWVLEATGMAIEKELIIR